MLHRLGVYEFFYAILSIQANETVVKLTPVIQNMIKLNAEKLNIIKIKLLDLASST